ncbi:hypothetical protein AB0E59_03950 [Lentzea sp. NPDC034063]
MAVRTLAVVALAWGWSYHLLRRVLRARGPLSTLPVGPSRWP